MMKLVSGLKNVIENVFIIQNFIGRLGVYEV